MNKTEPRTLAGFMELLPNEQILFEQMKQTIENVYRRYGFLPIARVRNAFLFTEESPPVFARMFRQLTVG